MSDVSVIGLGAMGSALARALLRAGQRVTVWNRTKSKADPLVRDGAISAPDPASAVAASPVVLVCVRDYEVALGILSAPDVRPHLSGRTLVQLGGGTPQEARDSERWAHDSGAEYIDGEIMVYPEQIGDPEATILVAGSQAAFRRCEPLLRPLAGSITYAGERIGAANAHGWALGSLLYGALLGALHGARICEVEGLGIDEFATRLAEADMSTVSAAVQDLLERVHADRYDQSQATLRTAADGAEQLLHHARETGIELGFPEYVAEALRRGMKAGLGDEDTAALIKVLRAGA